MNSYALSETDINYFYNLLNGRLAEIYEKIHKLSLQIRETEDHSDTAYSLHMGDAASSSTEREGTARIIQHLQNTAQRIDAAIRRIKDGSYGLCRITGKPIDRERLEAIPETDLSMEALTIIPGGNGHTLNTLRKERR